MPIRATLSALEALKAPWAADLGRRVNTTGPLAAVVAVGTAPVPANDILPWVGAVLAAEKIARSGATHDWIVRFAIDGWRYTLLIVDGDNLASVELNTHSTTDGVGDEKKSQDLTQVTIHGAD